MRSSRPAFAPPVALVKVLGILPVLGQYSRQRVSRTVRPTIVAVHRPQTEQPNTRTEQAQRYRQRGFGKSALFVPVRSCSFCRDTASLLSSLVPTAPLTTAFAAR